MSDIYLYKRRVATIFQLLPSLGKHEDDMSRAVGWVMSRCPAVMRHFVPVVTGVKTVSESGTVRLQLSEVARGRTDVEIEIGSKIHIIIEAKRSWDLPSERQLTQYARRLVSSPAKKKIIVVLTDCSNEYAELNCPHRSIHGTPVIQKSWAQFAQITSDSKAHCTPSQRLLIQETLDYLGGLITMQQLDSNWVFVVSLSSKQPPDWKTSWINVVRTQHRYFHPFGGNGWPANPPNYIGFRYYGQLQSIHRVEAHTVVNDIHTAIPEIPKGEIVGSHVVYRLGKPFRPDHRVPTGEIFRGGRRWCMLDTLFTCKTIAEASRLSSKREKSAPEFAPR